MSFGLAYWKNVEWVRLRGFLLARIVFDQFIFVRPELCTTSSSASTEIPLGLTSRFMKVYNLGCELDHRFEGWFSSEDDFIAQSGAMAIQCPICESHVIKRLPAAPRLNLSASPEPQNDKVAAIQAQVLTMVRNIVANTEDVGERFAEEARRIHYNEVPERAIRGTATANECEALMDEGIDVLPLPASALKSSLQ
jgi:hypothetical protein